MKRFSFILLPSLLLCGCSQQSEETVHIDEDLTITYSDVDEFLASDFCDTMKEDGFTVYLPSFDTEKYTISRIISSNELYWFVLKNTENDQGIIYQISYDCYEQTVDQLSDNKMDKSGDIITTAEKNGITYDVYLSKTLYVDWDEYNLIYLPFEDYSVYIGSDSPTPEAALSYIHDFDLVPAE